MRTSAFFDFADACLLQPECSFFQHMVAMLESQLCPLAIQLSQFIQKMLSAPQANISGQVRLCRITLFIKYMQQGQRHIHILAGPGSVITYRRCSTGAINAGYNV